jgi:hypothetical protein
LHAASLAQSFSAIVRDLSVQGIGLITMHAFVSGASLSVEAGPSGKSLATALTATVRHATTLPDGQWLLGCSFSRRLTVDDISVFG